MPRDPIFTRAFNLVFAANVFQNLSFFLYVHLPRFLEDKGANPVEVGVIVGTTALAAVAVRPPVGKALDTLGRRPVLIASSLVNFVACLLYLTIDSLGPWVYVVRVLHGLSEGALFTALFTYSADIVPASRRTEGIALFGVSGFVPMAMGGFIGDLVLRSADFEWLFITSAALALGGLLVSFTLTEPHHDREPGVRASRFFEAARSPTLLPLWLGIFLFSLTTTSYFTFLRTFVDEVGFGSVGVFFFAYSLTAILLRSFLAWLPERVGSKRLLFPAFALLGIGFVTLAGAGGGAAVTVAGVLTGAGHAYVFPILLSLTVTRAASRDRGSATAIFTALMDAGILVGGPLLGAIVAVGGYGWMYLSAAAIVAVGVSVFGVWDRRFEPLSATGST